MASYSSGEPSHQRTASGRHSAAARLTHSTRHVLAVLAAVVIEFPIQSRISPSSSILGRGAGATHPRNGGFYDLRGDQVRSSTGCAVRWGVAVRSQWSTITSVHYRDTR